MSGLVVMKKKENDPAYVCVWVQLGQNKERSG